MRQVFIVPMALMLATPETALAEDKPAENLSINFSKVKTDYKEQDVSRDASSGLATGKRMHKPLGWTSKGNTTKPTKVKFHDFYIREKSDKASPRLQSNQSKLNAEGGLQSGRLSNSATALGAGDTAKHSITTNPSITPSPSGPVPLPYPNIKR